MISPFSGREKGVNVSIPFFTTPVVAVAEGTVVKKVHCEQCQTEYVYLLHRSVKADAINWQGLDSDRAATKAERLADEKLKIRLEQDIEIVPCVNCGWYQTDMVKLFRRTYLRWLSWLGRLFSIGIIATLALMVFKDKEQRVLVDKDKDWLFLFVGIGVLGICAIGCFLTRGFLANRCNPNETDQKDRIALSRMSKVF
jgi:hypothetical protein